MDEQTPRELLAAADRERRTAEAADYARVRIRLLEKPVVCKKTGLLGWWRDRSTAPDAKLFEQMPGTVTGALYDALGIVMREANDRADRLEAKVTAASGESA